MKNHKQFWSWAAMAGLVFLLHVPSSAEALADQIVAELEARGHLARL